MDPKKDNDEEIRFRDQLAVAAMQALITREGVYRSYIEGEGTHKNSPARLKRIAITAYKIADEMRKARLGSFT